MVYQKICDSDPTKEIYIRQCFALAICQDSVPRLMAIYTLWFALQRQWTQHGPANVLEEIFAQKQGRNESCTLFDCIFGKLRQIMEGTGSNHVDSPHSTVVVRPIQRNIEFSGGLSTNIFYYIQHVQYKIEVTLILKLWQMIWKELVLTMSTLHTPQQSFVRNMEM